MKILIGPENVADALKDTSVVVASYDIGEGMRGVIGVVGPTRMDYAKITARLSYLAEGLSRLFGQGELPPGQGREKIGVMTSHEQEKEKPRRSQKSRPPPGGRRRGGGGRPAAEAAAEPPTPAGGAGALKTDLRDQEDKYLRLAAEYDNYRKRSQKEKETAWADAKADTVAAFLPVYDNLERALKQETADEAYTKGVEMTMNQLKEILDQAGHGGDPRPGRDL